MGQNNQQRRKAKQKDRARARHAAAGTRDPGRPGPSAPSGPGLADAVRLRTRLDELLSDGCGAVLAQRGERLGVVIGQIVELGGTPQSLATVRGVVAERLARQIRDVWRRGWQPLDLYAFLGRGHERLEIELLGDVLAGELATYPRSSVDDRWFDQLTTYEASVWWPPSSSYLAARTATVGSWPVLLEAAIRLLAAVRWLGPLEMFLPLPGTAPREAPRVTPVDDKVLFRVRQMLAKAESTPYEAEADTFTAAAQKLMARHSIDQAMLTAADPARRVGAPGGRRVWLATPYVKEKVLLLDAVARANRVRTVWTTELDMVTLVGYEVDLEAVDTLFTSLLLQATQAMNAEGKRISIGGGSRTRSFRASFLASYAMRIGERLLEVAEAETESAATDYRRTGAELVPVLSARTAEVEDYAAELFPGTVSKPISVGRDREGWAKGRQAAEQAKLGWGRPLEA